MALCDDFGHLGQQIAAAETDIEHPVLVPQPQRLQGTVVERTIAPVP